MAPMEPIPFPDLGYSDSTGFRRGNPRVAQAAENVVPRDPWQERRRLASRQGFVAVHDIPNDDRIQWMGTFRVYRDGTLTQGVLVIAGGSAYELGSSGVTAIAESDPGVDPTSALAATDDIEAVIFRGVAYIVNGRAYYKIDLTAATPVVEDWTATQGPDVHVVASSGALGDDGYAARLINAFGARLVLSGLDSSPTNWFMSSVADPDDWEPTFGPSAAGDGIAGGSTDAYGLLGEPITAIFPVGSDGFMFGTSGSLNHLTGDPQFGDTRLVTVSRQVGVAGPRAWAPGPEKSVFVCSTDGVYVVQSNTFGLDRGDRITADRLDSFFANADVLDLDTVLAYDDHQHLLFLFANRRDEPALSVHFAMDTQTRTWWPIRMADPRLPTVSCYTRFRPLTGERPVVWYAGPSRISTQPPTGVYPNDGMGLPGSPYNLPEGDGELDGVPFASSILMGPINTVAGRRILLRRTRVILGADRQSDAVSDETGIGPQLTILSGDSAQEAVGQSGSLRVEWEIRKIFDGGDSADTSTPADGGSSSTVSWDDTATGGFSYDITGRYEPQTTALPGSLVLYAGPGAYAIVRDESTGVWELTAFLEPSSRQTVFAKAVATEDPDGEYANQLGFASESVLDIAGAGFETRQVVAEIPLRRGMNNSIRQRVRASDIYMGIEARGRLWSLEDMSIEAIDGGPVRQFYGEDDQTEPGLLLNRE